MTRPASSQSPVRSVSATPAAKNRPNRDGGHLADNRAENTDSSSSLFRREDWTLFRNLTTLGQRAGVTRDVIPALVVKELVDNALDATGACRFGPTEDGGIFVENDGDGLPGTDEEIADLFSVVRPLTSSKLLRLPARGALGNGLRVVTGAVLASGGKLSVMTRGRALRLRPRDLDGLTDVERVGKWKGRGTRVEVHLGEALPLGESTFVWATQAAEMAAIDSDAYGGATSAWWYDADSFFELTQAAGARPVRALAEEFSGCSGAKAGKVAAAFVSRACQSLSRQEAETLLSNMRDVSRIVNPKRLGAVGADFILWAGYARVTGIFCPKSARGELNAHLPMVVEAWATPADLPAINVFVNRTPITAGVHASRCMNDRSVYGLIGCGLSNEQKNTAFPIKVGRGREYCLIVNIVTPYMPVTTDGKAPDLSAIQKTLQETVEKAIQRAKRKPVNNRSPQRTQAAVITAAIPAATDKASGNGRYRNSLRQLFYAVRPHVLETLKVEPDYNYFAKVVTEYESQMGGDLPGMYRDDRGTLYHPHTHKTISLGTRSVEAYERPEWTFNKILYAEKEGFFAVLIDAQWPERHDCALLTSKGFASRAARDVLDLLGDTDEPLTFYCLHDADGPGTMIYQTLQQGTAARPGRRVEIVNLGLDPAEALEMGLLKERVERKGNRTIPVADYLEAEWREWLQANRVELNAMDTPTFLDWLDAKMKLAGGKVIPPPPVLSEWLVADTRQLIHQQLVDDALRNAKVEENVEAAIEHLRPEIDKRARSLPATVGRALAANPAQQWTAPIAIVATRLATAVKSQTEE